MCRVLQTLLAVAVLGTLVGCRGEGPKPVIVASKDVVEAVVVGEMYALMLEESGIAVERRLNMGGTPILHEAIQKGEVDLYAEYTGTALLTVLKRPTNSDPEAVYKTVAEAYRQEFNLVLLDAAPMNNTQALATTREEARSRGLYKISNFAAQAKDLRLAGPPEFREREDGLPGIHQAYGDFTLADYIPVDPVMRYQVLLNGDANVVVAFGTDGEISAYDLVILEDDRHLFPPYQLAPVVRSEVLNAYPAIQGVLNRLAPLLTDEVMRRLNYEVSGKHREPTEVAREFLFQQGLIQ